MPQSLSNILVHLVFSTKHRAPHIPDNIRDELHAYIGGIITNQQGTCFVQDRSRTTSIYYSLIPAPFHLRIW